jgi:hypothetical protein
MRTFSTLSLLASLAFFGFSAAAPPSAYSGERSPASRGVEQDASVVKTGSIVGNLLNQKIAPPRREVEQEANVVDIDDVIAKVLNQETTRDENYSVARGSGKSRAVARDDGHRSLPLIILDVSGRIAPLCKKLGTLVAVDATVSVVTPIVDEIKVILAGAIVEVQLLQDHPIEYILYLEGRVLSINEVGQLVAALIILIYTAIAGVLAVVEVAHVKLVLALLVELSIVLADLLVVVFACVGGLQAVVVVLIDEIIPAILDVDCTYLIAVLGINY